MQVCVLGRGVRGGGNNQERERQRKKEEKEVWLDPTEALCGLFSLFLSHLSSSSLLSYFPLRVSRPLSLCRCTKVDRKDFRTFVYFSVSVLPPPREKRQLKGETGRTSLSFFTLFSLYMYLRVCACIPVSACRGAPMSLHVVYMCIYRCVRVTRI